MRPGGLLNLPSEVPDLSLLFSRLAEAGVRGHLVHDRDRLAHVIGECARAPLVCEAHPLLQAVALRLRAAGGPEPHFPKELTPDEGRASTIDTIVTMGLGAIPETGSILISARSPAAYRLSLRPRCHIIVIPAACAGLTLNQALEVTASESSGLVSWLTGLSRTADIEKTLVLGAQGPEVMEVIVYAENISWNASR